MRRRDAPAMLRADRRGAVLIEFALVLPLMVMVYLAIVHLVLAAGCDRRVAITARAMADLVSQYALLSPATLDTILVASGQMMTPCAGTAATIRVSQVTIDDRLAARIVWSDADPRHRPDRVGRRMTLAEIPATLRVPGTSLIYSDVSYDYDPGRWLPGPIRLRQSIIMMPRRSRSVVLSDG